MSGARGGGNGELVFNAHSISVSADEKVMNVNGGDGSRHGECTECHQTAHLNMVKMVNSVLYVFYHNLKKECSIPIEFNTING